MNCTEFETLLADYIDGVLPASDRAALEQHSASCPACREFLGEVNGGLAFLKRAEPVQAPPELITRIAYQAPVGRTRHPFEMEGIWAKFSVQWLQPLLRPRFAMGMAMTILSFAMLQRCTGVQVQRIQAADLSPVRIWDGVEDKVMRTKDRAVKYYENIRFIYRIESRLKDIEAQQETARSPQPRKSSQNGTTNRPDGREAPNQTGKYQGEKKK
ncbi:MAG: zf-HC2 domain-containing protein [Acidobacteriaceae bacterium]|nr:zf-HC2 domain-containing protein [Acidobacteriaceae bacterium]MBV9779633.1 zf-HC2 domain-containing protein [Acidobacteriaceae bacterium]